MTALPINPQRIKVVVLASWLLSFYSFCSAFSARKDVDRRNFLYWSIATNGACLLTSPPKSEAMGLMQFPCKDLGNTYNFIRSGQSLMEADDIWSTNPLFLTNREAALSPEGVQQVEEACQKLRDQEITIIRYSLSASSMDTANIIGRELKVGRDRLVPEFNFMDPRAIGKWDMLPLSSTEAAVWAMDADEAGTEGKGAKPPPNEDGTPHETLADQSIRLRQLLSVLETQYSGETIVLVFPDGTGPALLSAMIAGISLNRVHELEYAPGEIRLNVTMASTLALAKERDLEEYKNAIATGRKELKRLRSMKPDEIISVKDQKMEQDRLEMEAYSRKQEEKRIAKEQADRSAREARDRQIKETRQQSRVESEAGSSGLEAPVLIGAAGIGLVGATLALTGDDNEEETTASPEEPPPTNATGSESRDAVMDVAIMDHPSIDIPEIQSLDSGAASRIDIDTTARMNEDRQAIPPKPKNQDPAVAAKEAMNEYMDSDDGGSAWLEVMSDIMLEDDDEAEENVENDGS